MGVLERKPKDLVSRNDSKYNEQNKEETQTYIQIDGLDQNISNVGKTSEDNIIYINNKQDDKILEDAVILDERNKLDNNDKQVLFNMIEGHIVLEDNLNNSYEKEENQENTNKKAESSNIVNRVVRRYQNLNKNKVEDFKKKWELDKLTEKLKAERLKKNDISVLNSSNISEIIFSSDNQIIVDRMTNEEKYEKIKSEFLRLQK